MVGPAMLLGAATISTPWVPLEWIAMRDGKEVQGYVLQAEPGFLKVLTEHERTLLILTAAAALGAAPLERVRCSAAADYESWSGMPPHRSASWTSGPQMGFR
jgi:hypothetical protein